jgi:hypothetical protein
MTTTLSPSEKELLTAAAWRLGGLDLRFESGPWVDVADRLVDRGMLERHTYEWDYMVTYALTDAGKAAHEEAG